MSPLFSLLLLSHVLDEVGVVQTNHNKLDITVTTEVNYKCLASRTRDKD